MAVLPPARPRSNLPLHLSPCSPRPVERLVHSHVSYTIKSRSSPLLHMLQGLPRRLRAATPLLLFSIMTTMVRTRPSPDADIHPRELARRVAYASDTFYNEEHGSDFHQPDEGLDPEAMAEIDDDPEAAEDHDEDGGTHTWHFDEAHHEAQ
ncbi:hypothetical protein C8Q76DRAFT_861227 [Earliella scabrosa]|nr:hypothetical protein C8Q76DRAFT_861227 [Earliella scabrosa]